MVVLATNTNNHFPLYSQCIACTGLYKLFFQMNLSPIGLLLSVILCTLFWDFLVIFLTCLNSCIHPFMTYKKVFLLKVHFITTEASLLSIKISTQRRKKFRSYTYAIASVLGIVENAKLSFATNRQTSSWKD